MNLLKPITKRIQRAWLAFLCLCEEIRDIQRAVDNWPDEDFSRPIYTPMTDSEKTFHVMSPEDLDFLVLKQELEEFLKSRSISSADLLVLPEKFKQVAPKVSIPTEKVVFVDGITQPAVVS